ncbi:MAG: DUF924 family protein [Pseudomonadota bacterium]
MAQPQSILEFWFSSEVEPFWFKSSPQFDEELRTRFASDYERAACGDLDAWRTSIDGRLSLILLMDQIPRNIFRQTRQAFATDGIALEVAKTAIQYGDDLWFLANKPEPWRRFVYMPFMHSENLADQKRCVELFLTHGPDLNVRYARRHHDIIARFGRFPHRNVVLERANTPAEEQFLTQPGARF